MRNFWVEGRIDGRETVLSGGPRNKDGGLYLKIYQREGGESKLALRISCWAEKDGSLKTYVEGPENESSDKKAFYVVTKR